MRNTHLWNKGGFKALIRPFGANALSTIATITFEIARPPRTYIMELQYELREGAYHLYDMSVPASKVTGQRKLRLRTDTVAIAFDAHTGVLHDHGSPSRIQSWALNTRRRLRATGAIDSANSIVVVSGPLPVDEINKCLRIAGYCQRMLTRLATLPHGKRLAY